VNNPRVELLRYDFVATDTRHDFSEAAPWQGRLGDFHCSLEAKALEARPLRNYADEASARAALEPHLRAWELRSELKEGVRIEFRFGSGRVVDRVPGARSTTTAVHASDVLLVSDEVSLRVGHSDYPPPATRRLADSPWSESSWLGCEISGNVGSRCSCLPTLS
jgi:hypothetical protein